jgi:predicted ribosomally synthesized peptide with SipW-like signal peptide
MNSGQKIRQKLPGGTMSKTEVTRAQTPQANNSKRRKAKAILAGGLVLGIGAAVTLAAWNDSEFVFGNFGGGHFKIEGSLDGITFSEHDSSDDAATLSFTPAVGNMSPGDIVAAPYVVRLDSRSDYSANVAVMSSATGSDAGHFTYEINAVGSVEDCTVNASAATPIVSSRSIGSQTGAIDGTFSLPKPISGQEAESKVFCLKVTADPTLPQDASVQGTWELRATAVS